MIIVSLGEETFSALQKKAPEAQKKGDLIECRLDLLDDVTSFQLRKLNQTYAPLFTVRSKPEGGDPDLPLKARHDLLRKVMVQKPKYLDLEYKRDLELLKELQMVSPKTKVILSYHEIKKKPRHLEKLIQEMSRYKTWKIKIAYASKSTIEALEMLSLMKKNPHLIGICMGEKGFLTRVLGPLFNQPMTYASLDQKKTAPGQLSVEELKETYNYSHLNTQTQLLGLIGNPVNQSPGYRVYNKLFPREGINALYVNFEIEEQNLKEGIELLENLGFYGASVTIPFKEDILNYIDSIEKKQEDILSINTLRFSRGRLKAKNTDGIGALHLLEEVSPVKGKKVLIVGAGGTAYGIGFALAQKGAQIIVANRTSSKAKKLAKELGGETLPMHNLQSLKEEDYDILIQTTSVGNFNKRETLVPSTSLYRGKIVLDVVFTETKLYKAAQKKGCVAFTGNEFWIYQAKEQVDFWFKTRAPTIPKLMKRYMP